MRIIDYVQEGGPIMYILVLLNIIGMTIVLWKVFNILGVHKNLTSFADQVLKGFNTKYKDSSLTETLKHDLISEEIGNHVNKLEAGLNTVKIIATVSPLLGLLGTVIGILSAFEVISESGLSDPTLFAGGISMALITTVGGLIVAIPHLIGYNYLVKMLDSIEVKVEQIILPKVF